MVTGTCWLRWTMNGSGGIATMEKGPCVRCTSVTVTENSANTGVVGVPESTPLGLSVSPSGSVPVNVHVNGPVPAAAVSVVV